jgi:hypothetical protein
MLISHFLFFQDPVILKVFLPFQFTAFLTQSYVTTRFYRKMILFQQFLALPTNAYFSRHR